MKQTATDIEAAGGRAIALVCDVTDEQAVNRPRNLSRRFKGIVHLSGAECGEAVTPSTTMVSF